jgi:DNA-binding GntR family transcriptional regulator
VTSSQLRVIEKTNLSTRAYAEIRDALMNGQYEPGERLRIAALAEQMGVSITPVREAIFRLVSEQGLEMKAATAVHVPIITADHLREIQLIRHHLEGAAAEHAALNISPADFEELESLQERFVAAAAVSPKDASMLNREFHFAIMRLAKLPTLFSVVESLWVSIGPLLQVFHQRAPKRDLRRDRHRHEDVLVALKLHDSAGARSALQSDIAWGQIMIEWLEQRKATGGADAGASSSQQS